MQTIIRMLFYLNLMPSQKYSFSAAPYFQYLNIYFLQHVGAKKVFAKTAFQIWQVLLQFYYHFLKFRKCFGQWFLFYSSQCFIVCVFLWLISAYKHIHKTSHNQKQSSIFLKPGYNLLFWTVLEECFMQRHYSTVKQSPTSVSLCKLWSWFIVFTSYGL